MDPWPQIKQTWASSINDVTDHSIEIMRAKTAFQEAIISGNIDDVKVAMLFDSC
jgi:hypothetical protein